MTDFTPEAAQAEIDKINGDPGHDYWSSDGAAAAPARERMQMLHQVVHGDGPTILEDPNMSPELAQEMADAMEPPADPTGYDFRRHSDGVEDWDFDQERDFREVFHSAGLSQAEADTLMEIAKVPVPNPQETLDRLQARYGGDVVAMDQDIAAAQAAIRQVGGQKLIDYLNETGLGDHPAVIDMAIRKAKQLGVQP